MLRASLVATLVATVSLSAADPVPPTAAEVDALIDQAQNYILSQAQPNGTFMQGQKFLLGVTGLAAEALASAPKAIPATDPRLSKAIAFVNGFRQPDGGVYDPSEGLGNYNTSIALMLWTASGTGDPAAVAGAQNYIFGLQNQDPKNPSKGGMGYGSKGPGWEDLSNTSWAIAALRGSGVPSSDPRMQEALKFLERCQDLSSVNKLPWARDSGGAVYSPDESKADGSWNREAPKPGEKPPKLEPYGGMTYALISSYIVLDLKPEDPRVAAALGWVKANWTFDKNPGMVNSEKKPTADQQGLYYYYRVTSKTFEKMHAGQMELKDGRKVDWRRDLFDAISKRAKIEGDKAQWSNNQDRWAEGLPVLTTSYVLRSLKGLRASL
jgi:squalene-hopene/tetraprenyl-beta-curcumene cyclase